MRVWFAAGLVGLALSACQSGEPAGVEHTSAAVVAPSIAIPRIQGALAARRVDVVAADAELSAFLADLAHKADRPRAAYAPDGDYADVAAAFAPTVTVYSRSLDPSEPWHRVSRATGTPLDIATSFLVEQGDLPDGVRRPDPRPDLMTVLADAARSSLPMGRMPGMPGAICTDAQLAFDIKAARAFAATAELDPASLRLFFEDVPLLAAPRSGATPVGLLPAYTLLLDDQAVSYDARPAGWSALVTSNGIKGWVRDPASENHGLSQTHLCFAKVAGAYRIVGFYAYGL